MKDIPTESGFAQGPTQCRSLRESAMEIPTLSGFHETISLFGMYEGGLILMNIGIVGTAHPHVRDHIEVILGDERWELAGIWESNVVSTVTYPREVVCRSVGEVIERSDVIVVDTETDFHATILMQLLANGKPLFIEKPLGVSAAESRSIAASIRNSGLPFSTGLLLRMQASTNELKAALGRGDIGTILSVDMRFGHAGYLTGWFDRECAWMLDPALAGLRGLGDIGLHLVDLLAWLDPKRHITVRSSILQPAEVVAHGSALLSWGDIPVTLAAGWASNPGGLFITVEGSRGTAKIEDGSISFLCPVSGDEARTLEGPPPRSGIALRQFLEHLIHPEDFPIPTIDDAERASVLAYALEEASET
jgi:predicted dehydrogenase